MASVCRGWKIHEAAGRHRRRGEASGPATCSALGDGVCNSGGQGRLVGFQRQPWFTRNRVLLKKDGLYYAGSPRQGQRGSHAVSKVGGRRTQCARPWHELVQTASQGSIVRSINSSRNGPTRVSWRGLTSNTTRSSIKTSTASSTMYSITRPPATCRRRAPADGVVRMDGSGPCRRGHG